MTTDSPALSGVVVCRNEAAELADCLASLAGCDELVVVDLDSEDGSRDVAEGAGAVVLRHDPTPIRNRPLFFGLDAAANDWVVNLDPDERLAPGSLDVIRRTLRANPRASQIRLPFQYFLAGRPIRTTVWGRPGIGSIRVVHRKRVPRSELVHREFVVDASTAVLSRNEIDPVRHYWAESYGEVRTKLGRYARREGERLEAVGEVFSWPRLLDRCARSLWRNLVRHKGILGGTMGVKLSFIRAEYVVRSLLDLRRLELERSPDGKSSGG